jgi:hypothetical protein
MGKISHYSTIAGQCDINHKMKVYLYSFNEIFKHPTGFFIYTGSYFKICVAKIQTIDKKSIVLQSANKDNHICCKCCGVMYWSLFCDAKDFNSTKY